MNKHETSVKPPEHDPALIDGLVKLYHEKLSPSFQVYQEGRQAGIRYALLALGQKIEGIN